MKRLAFWLKKCFRKNNIGCRSFCPACEYFEDCKDDNVIFY